MLRPLPSYLTLACGLGAALLPSLASAGTVTVDATDSIYNANYVAVAGATAPVIVPLTAGGGVLTFSSVTGSVILNVGSGNNANNPDGVGSAGTNDQPGVSGTAGISGIVAPTAGYLAGTFLNGQESSPSHNAPAPLNFDAIGTSFSSLTPLDDQVFFIGDGLTGNGTGSIQQFVIPTDATELVLGFIDAPGYNGAPGSYTDNSGSFSATFNVPGSGTATPEPASLGIMGLGLAGVALLYRRQKSA